MKNDNTRQNKSDEPVDPSNTSHLGQNVSQGVINPKDGITEQSTEWENTQDLKDAENTLFDTKKKEYIKNPSQGERGD